MQLLGWSERHHAGPLESKPCSQQAMLGPIRTDELHGRWRAPGFVERNDQSRMAGVVDQG